MTSISCVQCIIKQLPNSFFVISTIIKGRLRSNDRVRRVVNGKFIGKILEKKSSERFSSGESASKSLQL